MIENIKIGNVYQHYKGNLYKIIAIAKNSEDPEQTFVVYQGLYDCPKFGNNPVWVRPIEMFAEKVVIDSKETPRFKMISK
jgi:hypothetical protein